MKGLLRNLNPAKKPEKNRNRVRLKRQKSNNESAKYTTHHDELNGEIKHRRVQTEQAGRETGAYNAKIGSAGESKGAARSVELNPSADEARADEDDEHGAHREPNHRHHQVNPRRYHLSSPSPAKSLEKLVRDLST